MLQAFRWMILSVFFAEADLDLDPLLVALVLLVTPEGHTGPGFTYVAPHLPRIVAASSRRGSGRSQPMRFVVEIGMKV